MEGSCTFWETAEGQSGAAEPLMCSVLDWMFHGIVTFSSSQLEEMKSSNISVVAS